MSLDPMTTQTVFMPDPGNPDSRTTTPFRVFCAELVRKTTHQC
jgi:hypothetical protein